MQITIEKGFRKILIKRDGSLYEVWDSLHDPTLEEWRQPAVEHKAKTKSAILEMFEEML